MAHSAEEEVARNFLCFGESDAVVVVCDATCLERNLNLVLQTLEISGNVLVCVNLMDEAARKHISIDLEKLSDMLGVPVVGCVARRKKSLRQLMEQLDKLVENSPPSQRFQVAYPPVIQQAVAMLAPAIEEKLAQIGAKEREEDASPPILGKAGSSLSRSVPNASWLAEKLLEGDQSLLTELAAFLREDILADDIVNTAYRQANIYLEEQGISAEKRKDLIVSV